MAFQPHGSTVEVTGVHTAAGDENNIHGQDRLKSRRAQLTEQFFQRSVLCEGSWLHYPLPEERDSSVTEHLSHAKTFEQIPARTNKFQNSFIPYCLRYYD